MRSCQDCACPAKRKSRRPGAGRNPTKRHMELPKTVCQQAPPPGTESVAWQDKCGSRRWEHQVLDPAAAMPLPFGKAPGNPMGQECQATPIGASRLRRPGSRKAAVRP